METLFDAIPYLQAYQPSFWVLGALMLVSLLQSLLTAPLAFVKEEQVPGMPLKFDHSKLSFRVIRTFGNSAETVPIFAFTLLLAIIVGASPAWVNWLAIIYLLARLAFWAAYYSGVGKVAGGPRTMAFVVGLIANFILVFLALWALF